MLWHDELRHMSQSEIWTDTMFLSRHSLHLHHKQGVSHAALSVPNENPPGMESCRPLHGPHTDSLHVRQPGLSIIECMGMFGYLDLKKMTMPCHRNQIG